MARFDIETLLAIETLPSGNALVYPVVAPELTSLGDEDDALVDQRLFLSEHLADAAPSIVSRFAIPASATPEALRLTLPRAWIPKRHRDAPEVTLHAVVVPHEGARWALVPALHHTVFVAPDEELVPTLTREVQRQLDAMQPDALTELALLPPPDVRFERVTIEVERQGAATEGTRALRKKIGEARLRRSSLEVLKSVAASLHDDPAIFDAPPVVGRTAELRQLEALLGDDVPKGKRRSVLLVGQERVGKSSVVRAWLRADPKRRLVFATSGAQLLAGMSGFGQWQARVQRVLEAAEAIDAVLYFDDLRDLFDRRHGAGGVDLAGAIKPALELGRVRLLGELSPEVADVFASRHEGFFSALSTVRVEPMDRDGTLEVLSARGAQAREKEPERPQVDPRAHETILGLAERYLPYRPFPGKAARLYDGLRAAAEQGIRREAPLSPTDVYRLFSLQTGIPELLLREDRALKAEEVRAALGREVIGQGVAVATIADALCVVKAALQPGDKPLGTFLFVGPTGVGKTELARALARYLYGSEERLIRFDMSEFSGPYAAERLIRGTGDSDGLLTRRVREQPFAVILLDEIEKAHPAVFDLLLQVAGEGRLTDARGHTAYFHNAILILTSNIGARHQTERTGFGSGDAETELALHYERAVRKTFRPEMVNRLDAIIPFGALSLEEIEAITHLVVARIASRRGITDRGAQVVLSEEAMRQLARDGHDPAYGARALRRHVEDALTVPLADALSALAHQGRGCTLRVRLQTEAAAGEVLRRVERGLYAVDVVAGEGGVARADLQALEGIMTLRREASTQLRLPSVEEQRERIAFLVAQMATANQPRKRKKKKRQDRIVDGAELARMQQEHHRLAETHDQLTELRSEIEALEELTLTALFEREEVPDDGPELVLDLRTRWRRSLLGALLEVDPQHQITLVCEEWDEGRALDFWLTGLLRDCGRRGWQAMVHLYKDPTPRPPDWPKDRKYGPPRDIDWTLERLAQKERERSVMLLRLRGKHCGTLLAAEAGLHRWLGVPPKPAGAHLFVRQMCLRAGLDARDWKKSALEPTTPPGDFKARRMQVVRWTDEREDRKVTPTEIDVPISGYWSEVCSDELALRDLLRIEEQSGGDRSRLHVAPLDAADATEEDS